MRIGFGSDIHKLVKGRQLLLGGIKINYSKGEDAFSDGDVLLHAISEAILGALAIGDLGTYFPNNNDKNKNIDSSKILIFVCQKMKKMNYKINNIDSTIFLEEPKISEYILKIRENLSRIINISLDKISVKACTNEKCDSVGQKKSIIANAIVLLENIDK